MRGALTLFVLLSSTSVYAEEAVLPAATRILIPEDAGRHRVILLEETHFLVERESLEEANAEFVVRARLEQELIASRKAQRKESSSLVTAAKWTGFGIALAGAVLLGSML